MYEYVFGKLIYANPTYAIIECNGLGYNIQISVNTYIYIKDLTQVKLYLHHIVREDAETMYGFYDEKERLMFRYLITVSGVGAATARIMISALNHNELYTAIVNSDIRTLKSIKGIGEKTAQRIVVDLADKLLKENFSIDQVQQIYNNSVNETLSALTALGFPKTSIEKAVKKVIKIQGNDLSVEELIKETLKII